MPRFWRYSAALPLDTPVVLALMQKMATCEIGEGGQIPSRPLIFVISAVLRNYELFPSIFNPRSMSLSFSLSCIFYIGFCVKSFPSELNPQSGPLLEPLSCWSALTLTPLFISGTQLSRSQVEESQRERQECKLVSQISASTLTHSSLLHFTHFLSLSLSLSLLPACSLCHLEHAKNVCCFTRKQNELKKKRFCWRNSW